MGQTLSKLLTHIIFSTKHRERTILPEVEDELYAYMGGICRAHKSPLLAGGGDADHVHLLVGLATTVTVAGLLEAVKKDSSKWIKTKGSAFRGFHWQDGYAAFSIGQSQFDAAVRYIRNQKAHHRRKSFQEELIEFSERYGVKLDERYAWT
jgi:REP element-mobilizing transposase RayT